MIKTYSQIYALRLYTCDRRIIPQLVPMNFSLPKLITHLKKLDFHFIFLDYIGLIVYIHRRKSDTRYYIIGLSNNSE